MFRPVLPGAAALAAAAGVLLAACGTAPSSANTAGASGVIQVVAAENFWGSIASQIGGRRVHVVSIITNPNTDPHSYEPTAADARTIAGAQLVVGNGIGYDPWVAKLLAAGQSHPLVLNVGGAARAAAPGPAAGSGLTRNIPDDVRQLFAPHFMVNAFRGGTIVAVAAGALGWFMVLRRQAFAGHTLAVVSFPGAAGAILLGVSATAGYFTACIAAALIIALVPRSPAGHGYSHESAVIGTVQAFALACGALFVSLYGGFLNSLTGLLFGTFLGISDSQVITLLLVALAAVAVLAVIARPLFFASIDPAVARARRVPVPLLGVTFLVLLGCAAAEVSQITAALLVFALLVVPAGAAQQLTARPAVSFGLTLALSLAITWLGLAVAYFSVYPVGFYITTFGFAAYVLAAAARAAAARLARRGLLPRAVGA